MPLSRCAAAVPTEVRPAGADPTAQGGSADEQAGERRAATHLGVGQQPQLLELAGVEQSRTRITVRPCSRSSAASSSAVCRDQGGLVEAMPGLEAAAADGAVAM
jgi:hypothetical protein